MGLKFVKSPPSLNSGHRINPVSIFLHVHNPAYTLLASTQIGNAYKHGKEANRRLPNCQEADL